MGEGIVKKALLSTSEAAKFLGISRIAVFKKIKEGRLAAVMIGNCYAIAPDALASERWRMDRREELRRVRHQKRCR